jgi:hypothetical protein
VKLSVIIPTHPGHRRFIKPCVEHCRALGAEDITILYDNKLKLSAAVPSVVNYLPADDVCQMVDSVLLNKRDLPYGGVGVPWYFEHRDAYGLMYSRKAELVLSINGDCAITNVKGFKEFVKNFIEGGYDIAPTNYHPDNFGTMGFLATGDGYVRLMTRLIDVLFDSQTNAETRVAQSVKALGLKAMDTGWPTDRSFSKSDNLHEGIWGKDLGFIHMHGTEKYRIGNKIVPLGPEFYDTRYLRPNEVAALTAYWKDKDVKHLYKHNYWKGIS